MKKSHIALVLFLALFTSCESFKRGPREPVNRHPKSEVDNRKVEPNGVIDADDRIVRPQTAKIKPKERTPLLQRNFDYGIKYRNIVCEDCWAKIEELNKLDDSKKNRSEDKLAKDDAPWYVAMVKVMWFPILVMTGVFYLVFGRKTNTE